MTRTSIQWTDEVWNPVRGCSRVSEGCRNCYAERQAIRQSRAGGAYHGLVKSTKAGPQWTGEVRLIEEHLREPLRWRKPRRVFVNSMSDLFHEKLADLEIARVWEVMRNAPPHTFQVLTKRPARMLEFVSRCADWGGWITHNGAPPRAYGGDGIIVGDRGRWPLPNVWLGVSVENQAAADERIPLLLQTPAAVRFLSCEPLLGPVDIMESIRRFHRAEPFSDVWEKPGGIDWVVPGGESGPGARPCNVQWIRAIVEQCREKGVPVFVKQLGSEPGFKLEDEERRGNTMPSFHHAAGDLFIKRLSDRKGGDPDEWPEDLRVREFPTSEVAA